MENNYEVPLGQKLDRLTIAIRKSYNSIVDATNVPEIIDILNDLISFIFDILNTDTIDAKDELRKLLWLSIELMAYNSDVWALESDIRKGKDIDLGLPEIGRRALRVREINDKRIICVNRINDIVNRVNNKQIPEEKKYVH